MARYWIVTTCLSRPCPSGQQHLESVRFTPGVSLSHDIPVSELLAMRKQGDIFLLADQSSEEEALPAAFRPCTCGKGFVLRTWRSTQDSIRPLRPGEQQQHA